MRIRLAATILPLLLILTSSLPAHDVVLKNGKTLKGTLVREDESSIQLKDPSGIEITIKKVNVDLEKTKIANAPAPAKPSEPPKTQKGRVYTKADLERLREQYDLGTNSFGASSPIHLEPIKGEEEVVIDSTFKSEVLQSEIPVIVDFGRPGAALAASYRRESDAVAAEYEGKAKLYKVNFDDNPDLARLYKISAIPTLLFFKDGEISGRLVGAVEQDRIVKTLKALLAE